MEKEKMDIDKFVEAVRQIAYGVHVEVRTVVPNFSPSTSLHLYTAKIYEDNYHHRLL